MDGIPVGQIRLDQEEGYIQIGYLIDKEYRNKGYGRDILTAAENVYSTTNQEICFCGRVKKENIASSRCFEKMGYLKTEKQNYIEYTKLIKE